MEFNLGQLLFGIGGLLAGIGALIAFLKLGKVADSFLEKENSGGDKTETEE